MAIPAVVDSLLRKQNIQYDVEDLSTTTDRPTDAVQTTLLCDSEREHRVQVLYPAQSLLDLNAVRQLTGWHQLHAMTVGEIDKLCQKQNFQHLPALPGSMGLPTLVDKKLLQAGSLTLSSGDYSGLLHLHSEQFKQSLNGATLGDFSVDLAELQHGKLEQIDDATDITHAVADFTQLRIKQRLEETLEIPPLPETAQRIIKLRVDPHADMRSLTTIVETDPALAAQVVSWAASPYYAAPGNIKSVHDAIVRVLGFDLVLNLALGLALGQSLSQPKDAPKGFTSYWHQAVYGAAAAESLVGCIRAEHRPAIGIAYLSGLLHNFGHLIMAEVFPPHFSIYCRFQEANRTLNYTVIERFLLGVTRDQLASWLMRLWSMPEEVCFALRFQNEPAYTGPGHVHANLLFIAMRLLRNHGIGNAPLEDIPNELYERLHLDPEKALLAIQQVVDASEEINNIASNLAA